MCPLTWQLYLTVMSSEGTSMITVRLWPLHNKFNALAITTPVICETHKQSIDTIYYTYVTTSSQNESIIMCANKLKTAMTTYCNNNRPQTHSPLRTSWPEKSPACSVNFHPRNKSDIRSDFQHADSKWDYCSSTTRDPDHSTLQITHSTLVQQIQFMISQPVLHAYCFSQVQNVSFWLQHIVLIMATTILYWTAAIEMTS